MTTNVGWLDRLMRLLLAAVLLYSSFTLYAHTVLGIGLAIAAVVALLTATVGFCPLYRFLGLRTCASKTPSPNP